MHVTARALTEDRLRRVAGETVFGRGEDYVRHVHGLRVEGTHARATIQAQRVYRVDLDWSGTSVDGECTCPHWADGNFCKHLVAVGLAALDRTAPEPGGPRASAASAGLDDLSAEELRGLVRDLMEMAPEVARAVQVRAAARLEPASMAKELTAFATEALRTRGFVDYRRSFEVARDAEEVLDELERHVDQRAADAVRPALLRVATRLQRMQADDSAGVLGAACQRAIDLYARACREGSPQGVKLARWLAKFRDESPGWPQVELADFVEAFDEKALAAYRAAVDRLDEKYGDPQAYARFEVDLMLLELADHDGDVDRAVTILARTEHPDYAGIVDRLNACGRDEEAFEWLERAVASGNVSSQTPTSRGPWLTSTEVAEAYVARDRIEDALDVLRRELLRVPQLPQWRALIDLAHRVGEGGIERARAMAALDELSRGPWGSGAPQVQIAIAEGDLDAAWDAAETFGPGHAWRELAGALARRQPARAAWLYRPWVDDQLRVTDSKRYPEIAKALAHMKKLCDRAGETEEFAAYLGTIREAYGRRPALMAELARRGL